jgi:hypothetical protein
MAIPIKSKRTYTRAFEAVRTLGTIFCPDGLEWTTELSGPARHVPIILHISCNAHFTLFIPYIAQEILRKLGKEFMVFGGPEGCCGSIQFNMGDVDLEEENARKALMGFNRVKPQLLVSVCPDCDEVFEKFRQPSTRFEIANISALLPRYLDALRPLLKPVNKRVVLHHHASDAAREADADNMRVLLEAIPGLEIVDSHKHIGPGVHCQTVKPMPEADQRAMFAEAVELGAQTVVVPYHSCYRQHCKMELEYPVQVTHYLGLLAESLGIPYEEPLKELRLLDDIELAMDKLKPAIAKNGFDEPTVRTFIERAVFL